MVLWAIVFIRNNLREREEKKMLIKSMNEIKNQLSPYKVGDEVLCKWGSSGYDQKGIVVDSLVNYNNCLEFTEERCEPACIIRFDNAILPTGFDTGGHAVVPCRQIKPL
jgi:hypothetical protein